MAVVVLTVPDVSCEHCEQTVKSVLGPLPGVHDVTVDLAAKQVRVVYDEGTATVDRMKEVLGAEEYPVASSVRI
ncbi:MAG TPA: heavy-metal-associated domain-containing protein [bacterium]|nr:heavy-metal-associated domain-containing protein [bacterium]